MRLNFSTKNQWVLPQPVMVIGTFDEENRANAMTAVRGGLLSDTELVLWLDINNVTTKNILKKKTFTVSFATEDTVEIADFIGITSANFNDDKMERAGLHWEKGQVSDAPVFNEFPMVLECGLVDYDENTWHLSAVILNIQIEKSVLGMNGRPDMAKLKPILYDPSNNSYHAFGSKLGRAYECGKKLR